MKNNQTNQAGERTQINHDNHDPIAHCVMVAALSKLNECRSKCPGIGGDIDASNLRYMIENFNPTQKGILQAADRLESLSVALEIDSDLEVIGLREVAKTSL